MQVGDDDGVEIGRHKYHVEAGRHHRRQRHASGMAVIRPHSVHQGALDLWIAPASNSAFAIGG
jgi:hypothetical protein